MFWPYFGGVAVSLTALLLAAMGLFVLLRKPATLAKKRWLACLAFLPLIVFSGDFSFRYVQHATLQRKWSALQPGMDLKEAEALIGPPDKIWQQGEAVKTLLFGWRNFRPMWEYDSPLTKTMLCFTKQAPYVRFYTSLDNLHLLGPSGKFYFQVDDKLTLYSIGQFTDADVY